MWRLRRMLPLVVAVVMMMVVAVGCSSPADDESVGGSVQIILPDGRSVTVPETPRRIVTLGGQWTDVLLAFDKTPVGYYDATETLTHQTPPWYGNKLADSTALHVDDQIVANVAKLDPDLIVAPGFASMSGEFEKLSQIAPTIDKISGSQVDPWQDMVTLMGTILHEPEKAQQIIAGVDDKISGIAREYPGLQGKTYSFAYMYGSDQFSVLGDPNDGAGKLFSSLGLSMAPRVIAQAQSTGEPRFALSVENLGWLDSDLLVIATENEGLRKRLVGLPGYKNLRSVKSDAVTQMTQMSVTGLNEPSPGATVYVLDQLRPALARAAGE
ncbi:ABC transporter substrate-binding protein [Gordonia desulfuricans]|nr:ABC transporter substrate-binding protein [Gordonia desulfuricans]